MSKLNSLFGANLGKTMPIATPLNGPDIYFITIIYPYNVSEYGSITPCSKEIVKVYTLAQSIDPHEKFWPHPNLTSNKTQHWRVM